jgi:hypothetical protein
MFHTGLYCRNCFDPISAISTWQPKLELPALLTGRCEPAVRVAQIGASSRYTDLPQVYLCLLVSSSVSRRIDTPPTTAATSSHYNRSSHAPVLLWLRMWVLVVLALGASIANIEAFWRSRGLKPDVPDSVELLAFQRPQTTHT